MGLPKFAGVSFDVVMPSLAVGVAWSRVAVVPLHRAREADDWQIGGRAPHLSIIAASGS